MIYLLHNILYQYERVLMKYNVKGQDLGKIRSPV